MAEVPFLQLRNLSKTFPGIQALKGVSFDVLSGQVHALVGENGAGKSTLIRILAGAESPDPGGEIRLQGRSYAPGSPRDASAASIATIFQVANLLPDRTVMHNVLLGREPVRRGVIQHHSMRRQTTEVLEKLNARHIAPDALAGSLTVAEKQVVEIAKALVGQSRLLIMDEPTAALNQMDVKALLGIVRRLSAQGVTILYVSHRLDEIFDLADTVTVLRDGEHISTRSLGDVNRDSLIEEMIGRRLSTVFPPRRVQKGDEILRVEGVSSGKCLLDISFRLHRGEILAVSGLSGSGKTELGRAVFGDLPIERGKITLRGKRLGRHPADAVRNRMSCLPEDRKVDSLLSEQSVRRNISLAALSAIASWPGVIMPARERQVAREQVEALDIKVVDLEQPVTSLSGGNQQKVTLGRCLAVNPDVFVLMEPTQGIDVGVKSEIYQFIARQAVEGKAVLLISSELPEILGLSHRILVMRDGRIVAELDTPDTNQEEILRHALGEAGSTSIAG